MLAKLWREKLIALPVQTIETPDGVILKRGCTEFKIIGPGAADAVRTVFARVARGAVSTDDILKTFVRSSHRPVKNLIAQLIERRLLVSESNRHRGSNGLESNLEILLWHFNESACKWVDRMNTVSLVIVGVNYVSRQLAASLVACGYKRLRVIDHPHHRNGRLYNAGGLKKDEWPTPMVPVETVQLEQDFGLGDCLIVTSDFGGQDALCQWNKLCIDSRVALMPVLLKNMIGQVGPLIIPGETPCYQCLFSRQLSHSSDAEAERAIDRDAFNGQSVVGFHPSMASTVGDISAFEITRCYGGSLPPRKPGTWIEVNLLAGSMTERTVLKVPRCTACSPLNKMSPTNLKLVMHEESDLR